MRRFVAFVTVVMFLVPAGAAAGPILDSAERFAARISPAVVSAGQGVGCSQAMVNGAAAADRHEGSMGYIVGGIFIPIIMPLIGMAASPSPPASEIVQTDDADMACFQEGYRSRGRSKKVRGGWIGTGIGIGFFVAVVVAVGSQINY